jgi:hypothetical protein
MSLMNTAEDNLLKLLLNNTTWANIGDATGIVGSGAAGVFYVSLHTADPGETGDQTTSEAAYTSYARVSVVRTTSGWTVPLVLQRTPRQSISLPALEALRRSLMWQSERRLLAREIESGPAL